MIELSGTVSQALGRYEVLGRLELGGIAEIPVLCDDPSTLVSSERNVARASAGARRKLGASRTATVVIDRHGPAARGRDRLAGCRRPPPAQRSGSASIPRRAV